MALGLFLLTVPPSYTVHAESGMPESVVQAVGQTRLVKGTVVNENGEPMIGVSIVVQGTNTGQSLT